jgi:hypothetical protein
MPLYKPSIAPAPSGTHDCRFEYVDANTCKLLPFGGNQIMISGVRRTIPSAGVSFVTAGAPWSDIIFYVFAGWTGSAIVINASVVSSSTIIIDANGMPVLQSDPSQTLIGMAWLAPSTGLFQQSASIAGVISYWNRKQRTIYAQPATQSTGSTASVELSAFRCTFVSFASDLVRLLTSGYVYTTTPGNQLFSNQLLDGTGAGQASHFYPAGNTYYGNLGLSTDAYVVAGKHIASFAAWITSTSAGNWVLINGVAFEG